MRFHMASAVTILILFAGCDNSLMDDGLRTAVRKNLKDPNSAQFDEVVKYKNFACIKYNAKNGYGGYGGASWALLEFSTSGWNVRDMDRQTCYSFELERLAEPKKAAAKDAEDKKILEEFKRRKLIDNAIDRTYNIPEGRCRELSSELTSFAHLAIDAESATDKKEWQAKFDGAFKSFDTIKSCQ